MCARSPLTVVLGDEDGGPLYVEVLIDGARAGQAHTVEVSCGRWSGCDREWSVDVPVDDLPEGEHLLEVVAVDLEGLVGELYAPVPVEVSDGLFVDEIEVLDSQEDGFNGPGLEVEAHLVDAATGVSIGCKRLFEVQEDGVRTVIGDGMLRVTNEEGAWVGLAMSAWRDREVQIAVYESDQGRHCPLPPELEGGDVDDLYGVSEVFTLDDIPRRVPRSASATCRT